jgi:hypothetical protein
MKNQTKKTLILCKAAGYNAFLNGESLNTNLQYGRLSPNTVQKFEWKNLQKSQVLFIANFNWDQ